jgi:hypothetical protein
MEESVKIFPVIVRQEPLPALNTPESSSTLIAASIASFEELPCASSENPEEMLLVSVFRRSVISLGDAYVKDPAPP